MTATRHVRAVRALLVTAVAARALLWGAVAGASIVAGAAVIDLLAAIAPATRELLRAASLVAALSTTAAIFWRDRAVLSLARVALWIEERFPSLEFALVTALETNREVADVSTSSPHWTRAARARAGAAIVPPVIAAAIAVAALLAMPRGAVARIGARRPGDALDRAPRRAANASRLRPLVADVVSPRYTGRRDSIVDEPTDVRALAGGIVRLRGRGDASGIVAHVGADSLVASREGAEWVIAVPVDTGAVAVRLADRTYSRIVAIEPVLDRAPSVSLVSPAHDTVLRAAKGVVSLAADVDDDFGIASASFEYIVSSGEGETFKFRSGTLGAVRGGGKHASLAARLRLDSLGLVPGDVVHLRAVARDANNATGPGVGESDTRTVRIARAGEYDSVAVEAAAPGDVDKSVISERMLITLAEALEKKRASLPRAQLVDESRAIGGDQTRLRRTVGDVVFMRLGANPEGEEQSDADEPARAKSMQELLARADSATNRSVDPIDFAGGESPVVAVNKPLLDAYNAMWDASTQLGIGEPGQALPHMRRALAAIELARRAERLYLRGAPPPVVVDISKVRLAGKAADAATSTRPPIAGDTTGRGFDARFVRVLALVANTDPAAVDSLLVLRIDALGDNAQFASGLGDAARALRRGDASATSVALLQARRALAGAATARDSLTRWGGVP